ncbi:MAG: DUF3137 domain-containing protein [Planctomycetota bacterium]|jgi:hypothetical protein
MSDVDPDDLILGEGLAARYEEELRSPDPEVRRRAAAFLGALGPDHESALPALRGALEDSDPGVRQAAEAALKRIRAVQEERLRAAASIREKPKEAPREAEQSAEYEASPDERIAELSRLGEDQEDAIFEALADEDPRVSRAAMEALDRIDAARDEQLKAEYGIGLLPEEVLGGKKQPGAEPGVGGARETLPQNGPPGLKPQGDLEEFYRTKLADVLVRIERRRLWMGRLQWVRRLIALGILLGIVFKIRECRGAEVSEELSAYVSWGLLWLVVLGVPALLMLTSRENRRRESLNREFKSMVIKPLVKFIDDRLTYSPEDCVSKYDFDDSRLFEDFSAACDFEGKDLVSGRLGSTDISFSFAEAYDGCQPGENVRLLFGGMFCVADFNKRFNGTTVVVPDRTEWLLGRWLGRIFQRTVSRRNGKLAEMENIEFEKHLAVYTSNQVEARYILTPLLMERIAELRKRVRARRGKNVYLSFVDSKMYVAVPAPLYRVGSVFDPQFPGKRLNLALIREHYLLITLLLDIVKDMELNTRIWTRE